MNFDQPARVVDWQKAKRSLLVALLVVSPMGSILTGFFWGFIGALVCAAAILCVAAGFWITEGLVGVFTRTKTTSPVEISLLFTGKLLWWGCLFIAARHMPAGFEPPLAMGVGSFQLALVVTMIHHYGMSGISDGNPPGVS